MPNGGKQPQQQIAKRAGQPNKTGAAPHRQPALARTHPQRRRALPQTATLQGAVAGPAPLSHPRNQRARHGDAQSTRAGFHRQIRGEGV